LLGKANEIIESNDGTALHDLELIKRHEKIRDVNKLHPKPVR